MGKFRKKPVVIEARRFESSMDAADLIDWIGDSAYVAPGEGIAIRTIEGVMLAQIGDWIIKGIEEEFYPCSDSVFKNSYEQVDW